MLITSVVLSHLGLHYLFNRKHYNLWQNTEFQNTIFSNTTRTFSEFFIILNQNGDTIFVDECIKRFFSEEIKSIYQIIPKTHHKHIEEALLHSNSIKIETDNSMTFSIKPLPRPNCHYALIANYTTIEDIYSSLLDEHKVGKYTVDSNNKIIESNSSFKNMIIDTEPNKNTKLDSVINDCHLKRKDGSLMEIYSSQKSFIKLGKSYTIGLVTPANFVDSEFEKSPIAICYCDLSGNNLASNIAFNDLIGEKVQVNSLLEKDSFFHRYVNKSIRINKNTEIKAILIRRNAIFACYFLDLSTPKEIGTKMNHLDRINSLGRLAGGIAHDFNNILTVILGFCDSLASNHPPGTESFHDIMQIKENSERASRLVQQILAFSSKQTLKPTTHDINNIIEMLSNFITRICGNGMSIEFNYQANPWLVEVDKGQMEQVLINLAMNAKNATMGKGELTIKTKNLRIKKSEDFSHKAPSGEYILISTSDNGCGISEDILPQIFDPFFSTRNSSGLGLATVHGIIKQFKGFIFVDTNPGKGTVFTILLPRSYSQLQHKAKILTKPKKKTVLLVEDEDLIRRLSKKTLMKHGYKVIEAKSGTEAIKLAQTHKDIEILITDIMMPGISGLEAATEITKIQNNENLMIIFISGYSRENFTIKMKYDYCFLQKPFLMQDIIKTVES